MWFNSRSKHVGLKASMISQMYNKTNEQCFTFWYYMYGRTMGSLNVFKRVNQVDVLLWKQGRDEGNYWRRALTTIKSVSDSFQVCNVSYESLYLCFC